MNIKTIILAIIIFAAILIAAFFLDATDLGVSKLMDMQYWMDVIKNIASQQTTLLILNLTGFFLALPIAYSAAMIAIRNDESIRTIGICTASAAIATAIAMFIFQDLLYYFIIGIFFVLSIALTMYLFSTNLAEYVKPKITNSANFAVNRGMLLIVIGCIVFGAVMLWPRSSELMLQTEYGFADMALGQGTGSTGGVDLSEQAADLLIQQETKLLDQLMASETYQKLTTKTDPDVIAYTTSMTLIQQQLKDPAFKQQLVQQIKQNQGAGTQQTVIDKDTMVQLVKKQFPFLQVIEPYYGLLIGLSLAILMGTINLITGILSMLYSLILGKIFKEEEIQTTAQN